MATLGSTAYTLADLASRMDDNQKIATIVELLSQNNEVLEDMLWVEGNLLTGHKTTVRTGLPASTWRLLNYGVQLSKSTTAPIIDTCGNLEAESQIDRDIARLNGTTAEFRLSEAKAFVESMSQTMAQTVFYGNVALNPERFMGLAPRYSTVNTANAASAANVIDAGGSGSDNTSIWIVNWGDMSTHGIFPKGGKAGLNHEDKGEWRVNDGNGNPYWAIVDHFKWECGLTVRDWRYNVRVANIDVSDLNSGSPANLINLLIRAVHRLPTGAASAIPFQKIGANGAGQIGGPNGRTVIYCNRTVRTYLDIQASNRTNMLLTYQQWDGKPQLTFRGIPIKNADVILNTEARVT